NIFKGVYYSRSFTDCRSEFGGSTDKKCSAGKRSGPSAPSSCTLEEYIQCH
ncbi:unnamed protein product, partial [Heterosigma akashiwo]